MKANTLQAIDGTGLGGSILCGYTAAVPTVGKNIAIIRAEAGLSQVDLADRLKMRQPSIWKLEHSKGLPNCATLFKVAVALRCSIERLVAGVNAEYDKVVENATISELAREVARQHKPPRIRQTTKRR